MHTSLVTDSATMSAIATRAELSTWANMRLASSGNSVDHILKDIMEGETMKLLLQSEKQANLFLKSASLSPPLRTAVELTGSAPKRLGSLAG